MERHCVRLARHAPAIGFFSRRQVKTDDPLRLANSQAPAVWAEGMTQAIAVLAANDSLPIGHAPDAQRLLSCQAEHELLVGTQFEVGPRDGAADDALNLLIVGDTANADDASRVRAGVN